MRSSGILAPTYIRRWSLQCLAKSMTHFRTSKQIKLPLSELGVLDRYDEIYMILLFVKGYRNTNKTIDAFGSHILKDIIVTHTLLILMKMIIAFPSLCVENVLFKVSKTSSHKE